jgi:hypothetical protein
MNTRRYPGYGIGNPEDGFKQHYCSYFPVTKYFRSKALKYPRSLSNFPVQVDAAQKSTSLLLVEVELVLAYCRCYRSRPL